MSTRSKRIGTAAETAVVRYLQTAGWPHAERRALRGVNDAGDITGTPAIAWEIKAGTQTASPSDLLISTWLMETDTERQHAGADVGVLVLRRPGVSEANAGRWWAWLRLEQVLDLHGGAYKQPEPRTADMPVRMQLADLCALLNAAGYGDRKEVLI